MISVGKEKREYLKLQRGLQTGIYSTLYIEDTTTASISKQIIFIHGLTMDTSGSQRRYQLS